MARRVGSSLLLIALGVGLACGSSTTSSTVECCARGGGSCAGGGSKRLNNGSCPTACDCLKITGSATDADGCVYDTYVSTYPNCGGMVVDSGVDSGDAATDAPTDSATDAKSDGGEACWTGPVGTCGNCCTTAYTAGATQWANIAGSCMCGASQCGTAQTCTGSVCTGQTYTAACQTCLKAKFTANGGCSSQFTGCQNDANCKKWADCMLGCP